MPNQRGGIEPNTRGSVPVDLDLHGYVRIRLLDATPRDLAKVIGQLGPLRATPNGEPDITVRFVDDIRMSRGLTYVGLDAAGFDDDAFYVLRGRTNIPARARIPFQDVGGRCEIVCERRMPTVPLLLAILNMTALAKGLLPLHASAFEHDGIGVLATGWAKGGKTETLLAFASLGARYIGDEWVYLAPDRTMYGVPEPIRLWRWHLQQLPAVRRRLTRRQRLRIDALHTAARAVERSVSSGSSRPVASVLRRLAPVLRRQVYVQLPPEQLFGADALALHGRLDELILVASHDDAEVRVEPVGGDEVGRRMLASLQEERTELMSYYRQFRFAFPGRSSPIIERASELECKLVSSALNGLACSWLRHPYPVDISSLVRPVEGILSRRPLKPASRLP